MSVYCNKDDAKFPCYVLQTEICDLSGGYKEKRVPYTDEEMRLEILYNSNSRFYRDLNLLGLLEMSPDERKHYGREWAFEHFNRNHRPYHTMTVGKPLSVTNNSPDPYLTLAYSDSLQELVLECANKYAGSFAKMMDREWYGIYLTDADGETPEDAEAVYEFTVENNRAELAAEMGNDIRVEGNQALSEGLSQIAESGDYISEAIRLSGDTYVSVSTEINVPDKVKCSKLTMGGWE